MTEPVVPDEPQKIVPDAPPKPRKPVTRPSPPEFVYPKFDVEEDEDE